MFLGNPSARVRDELWEKSLKAMKGEGSVLQVWSDNNPQGFSHRQFGMSDRQFVDFEGLALIRVPHRSEAFVESDDTTGE